MPAGVSRYILRSGNQIMRFDSLDQEGIMDVITDYVISPSYCTDCEIVLKMKWSQRVLLKHAKIISNFFLKWIRLQLQFYRSEYI